MYKIIGANQVQYGPVSADQLRQWITEGRADANTQVQPEGASEWKPLGQLPEFAGSFAPAAPPGGSLPLLNAPPAFAETVPNYLVHAILCTLCCCLPFGIVAIVYAAQVNGKLQAGDYEGAAAASKNAKMWCWIAFGLGIVTSGLAIALQIAAGALSGLHH